ncbi:MAG: hypothetical protein FWG39_04145 [Alphaproteobacteria bacterium]|nr:hypothetical protein [Alphaproteobacteria bacterium]
MKKTILITGAMLAMITAANAQLAQRANANIQAAANTAVGKNDTMDRGSFKIPANQIAQFLTVNNCQEMTTNVFRCGESVFTIENTEGEKTEGEKPVTIHSVTWNIEKE